MGLSVDRVLRLGPLAVPVCCSQGSAPRCRAGGSPVWLPNLQVLCSTSSMEEGASARPHSPRQRTCSRTDCLCVPLAHTGIHLIGRRRDDHHHVRSPPWPPPPRATAAETAAATPHRIALHRIETGVAWAVTRVLVHRAALLKRSGMGANAASWHSLSPSLIISHAQVCIAYWSAMQ